MYLVAKTVNRKKKMNYKLNILKAFTMHFVKFVYFTKYIYLFYFILIIFLQFNVFLHLYIKK